MKIREFSQFQKPREKLMLRGVNSLTDSELIAILLQSGTSKKNVVELSQSLLDENGGLPGVFDKSIRQLTKMQGIGPAKAMKLVVVNEITKRISQQKLQVDQILAPQDIFNVFKYLIPEKQEHLCVLCVDTKSNVISYKSLYVGTVNEISIHPREILKYVVDNMAYAFFLVHNHPSGNPTPSQADIQTTQKIFEASKVISIELLDHIVIALDGFCSIRQSNPEIFN